jgi:hypothetical protein
MNKKETLLYLINQFEENAKHAPEDLLSNLHTIKQQLESLSNEEIEMLDGPTTSPAGTDDVPSTNPVIMLHNAYSEMEKLAFTNDNNNEELNQVIHQMRGFYDIPERHFP